MSEVGSVPVRYRTGWLWGILALFLMLGTVAAAFVVYGLTDLWSTGRWFPDLPITLAAGFAATFLLLLITGILYRVDRLRGVPHRQVRLFD
ncbi:MAG: hypothetical protein ACREDK_07245 [Thermoplasmata archaeon]